MAEYSPQGGDIPRSEKLPQGYFDDLSAEIWRIGNLAAGDLLANSHAPSRVYLSTIRVEQLGLDLAFDFRVNSITECAEPARYEATMSDIESLPDPKGAELWSWQQVSLDQRRRRREFSRGTSIVSPKGEEQLIDLPPISGRRKRGSAAWRHASEMEFVQTADDYDWLMGRLAIVRGSFLPNS